MLSPLRGIRHVPPAVIVFDLFALLFVFFVLRRLFISVLKTPAYCYRTLIGFPCTFLPVKLRLSLFSVRGVYTYCTRIFGRPVDTTMTNRRPNNVVLSTTLIRTRQTARYCTSVITIIYYELDDCITAVVVSH